MTTRLSRCWLLAALFLLALPLSALAQSAEIDISPNTPVSGVAGTTFPGSGVSFLNSSGGTLTDVEIQVTALPAGVTWTGCINSGIDITNLSTTGIVTIASLDDAASAFFLCNLTAAPDVADGTVFTVSAEWVGDPTINDTSSEITVNRETNFTLGVSCTPDTVLAGSGAGNLSCTVDVGQTGPSDASNVAVAMTLPTGVTVDSGTPSVGSWADPNWTIGPAAVGFSATLDLVLTVDSTATGDLTIQADLTADETNNGTSSASDVAAAESAGASPTSFLTTIGFTNGYDGMVTVMLSCNSGTPLQQDFEISSDTPVNFVVDLLDFLAPDVNCSVTLSSLDDGYVGSFLANGIDTGDACVYASDPQAGEAPFDQTLARANTCEITAEPVSSTFEVEKLWEFDSNSIIDVSADIHIWCAPASEDTGPSFGTVETWVTATSDATFALPFYPDWDGGATCYAQESNLDSAVESDNGCAGGTDFEVGDDEGGCTITNTVFFEGIPTLSQYGLALMALLMLGVGFVGLRRFV